MLRSIPDGSEIGLRFTMALEPKHKNEAPFIRMSLIYIGVVAEHEGNNVKVNVTHAADYDTPGGPKLSKANKKITVTPEDLLQQYPKIPPRFLILYVKPPADNSNNNSNNSNSNSNSEGGRRRKTRKTKKAKKTRSRK